MAHSKDLKVSTISGKPSKQKRHKIIPSPKMIPTETILTPQDPKVITKMFFKIAESYTESITKIKLQNNALDDFKDSRIVAFIALREVANNSLLTSVFLKDHLNNEEWWKSNKNFKLPIVSTDEYIKARIHHYGVDLSTNFIMLSFTHFENSLRSIVRAIPSSMYPQATESFWKLRDYLISVSAISTDYKNLLSIFQHIRNSNHNGGFHMMPSETITYNGKTYVFEQGKPVTFDPWVSIEFIMLSVNNFMFDLMTSPAIKSIPNIPHPFGTITFIEKTT